MQVVIDPKEVQKFRHELKTLAENLDNNLKETDSKISNLSQTWNDINFKTFCDKFEEDKKKIRPLIDDINEFESQWLAKTQSLAEEILAHLA